ALSMGITENQIMIPEHNIQAASRLIRHLDDALKAKVPDVQERMKFVIAAYNSGLGHIFDSIDLAAKYGLDPEIWTGNVSEAALMKSRPQYYNDPVVKNGYFRGRETVDFVDNVVSTYYFFKKLNNNRN
ncbi:MAG: transglycosylase SLT domain-containing protein, partial [Muribaculaceae bacterium]|nr:transglycosylase SLT domain-containing protein [Muribaculaceae bacterium]